MSSAARDLRRELRDPNHAITQKDRALFAESAQLWTRVKADLQRLIQLRLEQHAVNKKRNPIPPELAAEAHTLKSAQFVAGVVATGLTVVYLMLK
jgi:hypothetical protein